MKLFDVYPLFDIEPVMAKGSYIWDKNGTRYLDLYGGHAVISIGHSHPHYIEMLSQQLGKIGFYSNSVKIPLQEELAHKLGELSGYPDYQLFLCNSGAEANENALKLASFHNKRKRVIAFSKSFHGRTSLAVATTDDKNIQAPVNENPYVTFLPFNDMEALENEKGDDVCAVIIEGIQGVGGVNIPAAEFLNAIRSWCDRHGALMILDEIQSGYGRSGKFFAHQHSGVTPDIITVAKGMGNGFPVAGVLIAPEIKPRHGILGTTFGGNHLACAAAIAVLDVIKNEGLIESAEQMGNYISTSLISASLRGLKGQASRDGSSRGNPLIGEIASPPLISCAGSRNDALYEIRALGLMIGVELNFPSSELRNELLNTYKIFTGSASNKNVLRILPALNITKQEADLFLNAFFHALNKITKQKDEVLHIGA